MIMVNTMKQHMELYKIIAKFSLFFLKWQLQNSKQPQLY